MTAIDKGIRAHIEEKAIKAKKAAKRLRQVTKNEKTKRCTRWRTILRETCD